MDLPGLVRPERGYVSLEDAPVTFADSLAPCDHGPVTLGNSLPEPGVGPATGTYGSSTCRRALLTGDDGPPKRGSDPAAVGDGP